MLDKPFCMKNICRILNIPDRFTNSKEREDRRIEIINTFKFYGKEIKKEQYDL